MEISSEDLNQNKTPLRLVETYYKIQKIIGKGAFGVVYKAFELCSGRIVAIKQIPVNAENKKSVIKEIELLKNLEHPNIVKYYNFLKEDNHIYIIMEYLEGSTLRQYMRDNSDNITEDIAREIIKQLLNALSYLHYSCDICHRDIKPENIMFTEKDNISHIKLLDFGLSSDSFESKLKMQNCGTITYMAPEQISSQRYTKSVDIWSVGIIVYRLLNKGKNPFYNKGDTTSVLIDNINHKEIEFDLENCPISPICRHFIYKLLDKNPAHRYSARLALNHPWITMNKFDKIPMTLYDKIVEDESIIKLNMLLVTAYFMLYYKKKYLKIASNRNSNNENINDKQILRFSFHDDESKSNNGDMEDYEKKVAKMNEIYENKFKENREIMFLPKSKSSKDITLYLLKMHEKKIENKKSEDFEINNDKDDKEEKEENLDIYTDKESDSENKEKKDDNEVTKQFISSNIQNHFPKKSILKKNNLNESPINYRNKKRKQKLLNEQGKTPDISQNILKYDQKMSNKLISFRLSIGTKDIEHKHTFKPILKNNLKKPIKLQSIKNTNEFINKSKTFKFISKNNENAQNELGNFLHKNSKSTKNEEKDKKISSCQRIKKKSKLAELKGSLSVDIKYNKINENHNISKLNYKPIKFKDDYEDIDSKLNINNFNIKSKNPAKKIYVTSIKKTKNNSMDKSHCIQPKKLFHNNTILPLIQNK
jgi:serine/threonine protein kinase